MKKYLLILILLKYSIFGAIVMPQLFYPVGSSSSGAIAGTVLAVPALTSGVVPVATTGGTNLIDSPISINALTNISIIGGLTVDNITITNVLHMSGITPGSYLRVDSLGNITNSVRITPVGSSNISILGTLLVDSIVATNTISAGGQVTFDNAIATNGIKFPNLTLGAFVKVDSTTGYLTNVTRLSTVGTTNISLTGTLFLDSESITNQLAFFNSTAMTNILGPGSISFKIQGSDGTNNSAIGGTGEAGPAFTISSGKGGNATGASGTRTGGNSGTLTLATGAAGTGATANGTPGNVVISPGGTAVMTIRAASATSSSVVVNGLDNTIANGGMFVISTTDVGAINKGGSIELGGNHSGSTAATFSIIKSAKESSSGTFASYLAFHTRIDGGGLTEQLRIGSAGLITLQGQTTSFPAIKRNGAGIDIRLADDSGYATLTPGNIIMPVAKTLSVTSGTNQRAGNATLVGGTITVNNTTVTANTIVMLTRKTSGGTIGTAITYTVSAATSFTINSDNILDTSAFSYYLIEVP